MGKKSKRGSGPRPGSNRAERVAARKARQAASLAGPVRPFKGLAAECDLVAMRTFIASATATVPFAADFDAKQSVEFATVLPGAVFADVSGDAQAHGYAALQTDPDPDDLRTSVTNALAWAATATTGSEYDGSATDLDLADIVDPAASIDVTVHDDFAWWFADETDLDPQIKAMLERANDTILPTARLTPASGVGAPWWVDAGEKAHLRWVRPEDEDSLMNALARVHDAGGLTLGDGSRFAGSFRTHGLLVPVFDLDVEAHHSEWNDGLDAFDKALTEALADTSDLTAAQRASKAGIIARQVTIR
ncbi:DUF5926 family protein [Gordonia sp. HY002]|uniref:DUF5926 family protein n=1 Tax=Gordonia zhenghanii TaxID=2911516 RepID=UPI001EF01B47|nr:DUF5926 family protein [Gordonia zhenghanii]MCF8571566.1 DUF5926 family protein [Gordonia zhenghanii]MCF8602163.1 DUF5926 family protein [Gordonia zhenghanii]